MRKSESKNIHKLSDGRQLCFAEYGDSDGSPVFLFHGNPGSRFLVVEMIVPHGNESSVAKLLDLEMLIMTGGREQTEAEFRDLIESSAFKLSRMIPTEENI